jgi:hypothetical protein
MDITSKDGVTHFVFDSTIEYAEFAEKCPDNATTREDGRIYWHGGTWEDACKQVRTGNPELVKQLFEGSNIVNALIESDRNGEIRDVTGEYFDVADFLSGEPEVFRRQELDGKRQVVPVWVNFGMLCDISTKTIINRGSAIVALVDELKNSGYIVDLRVVKGTNHNRFGKIYADIKLRTDPVDLDELAFLIANPLNLRRMWFACLESWKQDRFGDMGATIEYDLSELFESGLSGFYFVGSSHKLFRSCNYETLKNAKEHISEMINQFKESAEQVIIG